MVRGLLVRGMLAGLAAAVAAFAVATLLGESQVDHAIAFESAGDAATGAHDEELVSRTVQSTLGLAVGLVAFSVTIGGIFSLAYACAQGRLGAIGVRGTAALVALGGFAGLYLLPGLKYPANPPAVGNPDTIGQRTVLYLTMMAVSLAVVIGGAVAARGLAVRFGGWNGGLLAAGGGLVVLIAAYLLLPTTDETPAGFPADVLWRFRLASLVIHATIWSTIGLLFGALTDRHLRSSLVHRTGSHPPATGTGTVAADSRV